MAAKCEPIYFFANGRDRCVTRGLDALLKFHMIDQEARDGLLDLYYEGQDEDKKIVEALIDSHIEASDQKVKDLEKKLMNLRLVNNPSYQNGYFLGVQMIPTIAKTGYGTLKDGIVLKNKEITDLKDKFDWSDQHAEIAEKLGTIAAWEDELSTQNIEQ